MDKYELMYIINASLNDEEIQAARNLIEKNFTEVEKVDTWGMRDLAYEINKQKRGYYVVVTGKINKAGIEEILHISKISKNYLRHLLINLDKEKTYNVK